jgi:hypothetical protein
MIRTPLVASIAQGVPIEVVSRVFGHFSAVAELSRSVAPRAL